MLGEAMTSPILVTGGTGTLGRLVVQRLRDAGRNVRVLSRRSREAEAGIEFMTGDLTTGEGIEPAADGVETIVHLAGSAKGDEDKTRNLVQAASSQTRLPHLVYISVVGADRIPVASRRPRCTPDAAPASGVHLGRRRGPHPRGEPGRPRHVRLLRVQAGRGEGDRRLRTAVDDAARDSVSRGHAGGGAADGEAAGATGPGWVLFPTARGRRGGLTARRAHSRRAIGAGTQHGWAAGIRRGRAAPRVPSCH